MSFISLNGFDFEKMLKNGLKNIQKHEKEVNEINVFPVPDGDTGTNMRLTLENGIKSSISTKNLGFYLESVRKGMLLGARGNSGVILSQLFAGMSIFLVQNKIVTIQEFIKALQNSYKIAYESVINPVEGTILTVAREGIVNLKNQISSFEELFQNYIFQMQKSLQKTPESLPILKESNVLDSGAVGYIYIFDGMYKFLCGEELNLQEDLKIQSENPQNFIKDDNFNENSKFEDGYCTEFLLQLLKDKKYNQNFDLKTFIKELEKLGNSLVAIQDGKRVKVHIHSKNPSPIISFAQNFGEFVTFKMENMQIQHNQQISLKQEKNQTLKKKSLAIIAVSNGKELSDLYKKLGCDIVLESDFSETVSIQDFLAAYKNLNAEKIIILPNNKNVYQILKKSIDFSENKNIKILKSMNIAEGYYALALGNLGNDDYKNRIKSMEEGINSVDVISISEATKDDFIALLNEKVVSSSENFEKVIKNSVKKIENLEEKESCIVFEGLNSNGKMNDLIKSTLEKVFPNIEVVFIKSGQKDFNYVIGF